MRCAKKCMPEIGVDGSTEENQHHGENGCREEQRQDERIYCRLKDCDHGD